MMVFVCRIDCLLLFRIVWWWIVVDFVVKSFRVVVVSMTTLFRALRFWKLIRTAPMIPSLLALVLVRARKQLVMLDCLWWLARV